MIRIARGRRGFTLVELMASMAIMAVAFAVVGLALTSRAGADAPDDVWITELRSARAESVARGIPIVVWPDSAHVERPVLMLPDGRRVGEPDGFDLVGTDTAKEPER